MPVRYLASGLSPIWAQCILPLEGRKDRSSGPLPRTSSPWIPKDSCLPKSNLGRGSLEVLGLAHHLLQTQHFPSEGPGMHCTQRRGGGTKTPGGRGPNSELQLSPLQRASLPHWHQQDRVTPKSTWGWR